MQTRHAAIVRSAWRIAIGVAALAAIALGTPSVAELALLAPVPPALRPTVPGHTAEVLALTFSHDGKRLYSAGLDKVVYSWSMEDLFGETNRGVVGRPQAIRWPVLRGPLGHITSVAESAGATPSIAFGGRSTGKLGDVVFVADARTQELAGVVGLGLGTVRSKIGSQVPSQSMAFTKDGSGLVVQYLSGRICLWERNPDMSWSGPGRVLRGEDGTAALEIHRPMALSRKVVIAPVFVGPDKKQRKLWRLQEIGLTGQPHLTTLPGDYFGEILGLAVTGDGGTLYVVDADGGCFKYDRFRPASTPSAVVLPGTSQQGSIITALAVSPDGRLLAVGSPSGPRLEIWDTRQAPPRKVHAYPTDRYVQTVCFSPNGQLLAWTGYGDHSISAARVAAPDQPWPVPVRLGGYGKTITRVAFSRSRPVADDESGNPPSARPRVLVRADGGPHIALSTGVMSDGKPPAFHRSFGLRRCAVDLLNPRDEANWALPAGDSGGLVLMRPVKEKNETAEPKVMDVTTRAGSRVALIETEFPFKATAGDEWDVPPHAWLRVGGKGPAWAIAVADGYEIRLYNLSDANGGRAPMMRRLRGHDDDIASLAISEDGRWLASGGRDGFAMLWSLAGVESPRPSVQRWGIEVAEQGGKAVVTAVEPAGPLRRFGVEVGDCIVKLGWNEQDGARLTSDARTIVSEINGADKPFFQLVKFTVQRGARVPLWFQSQPVWENTAGLLISATKGNQSPEWAYFTWQGVYAASGNGNSMFGWLVNEGFDRLPRFYQARDFRRLEKPEVMDRLYEAGSLKGAAEAAGVDLSGLENGLADSVARAPTVRISEPVSGVVVDGKSLRVVADVAVPPGVAPDGKGSVGELVVRAFVSGIPDDVQPQPEVLEPTPDGGQRLRYSWSLDLPAADRHLVHVYAGWPDQQLGHHDDEAVASRPRDLGNPRLFMAAIGVNTTSMPENRIPRLEYAGKDARDFAAKFSDRAAAVYDVVDPFVLVDGSATSDRARGTIKDLAKRMSECNVGPDDLLVVFLAGHGGGRGTEYRFFCTDFRGEDGEQGVLGWDDFKRLAEVPCRKLVFVDTCSASGIVARESSRLSFRDFQENQIVVLASSQPDQKSWEWRGWENGCFTEVLLEALDGNWLRGGGRITAKEVFEDVLRNVPLKAATVPKPPEDKNAEQQPTIVPADLLEYLTTPLGIRKGG